MRTMKIVPEICKGEGAKFSGELLLRVPNASEKLELLEQVGVEVNDNGEISAKQSGLATTAKMIRASESFYQKVDLKRLSDNSEFKNFDDLHYESDCMPILIEMAQKIFSGGVTVSKN
jgi:hypothetical protein